MEINEKAATDTKLAPKANLSPYCNTIENQLEEKSTANSWLPKNRVCPYCETSIPSDEDPCHICGHLEPASIEMQPCLEGKEASGSSIWFLFWTLLYLYYGISMIVSPGANPSPGYECNLNDSDDCFLPYVIWSRPGGILLVSITLFTLGKFLLSKINPQTR